MKKRIGILMLSSMLVMNQLVPVSAVHAIMVPEAQSYTLEGQVVESERIYVQDGEGAANEGKGTAQSPYQNIRTALDQIQPGQTLVLMGEVSFTTYDMEVDGSAKPLFINKNITITGATPEASLKIRTAIQLGADVTFRSMRLQMLPETILGGGSSGKTLGTIVERSATIYAAGHTLVLDSVNTKLGTSVEQDNTRPYISGGAYKGKEGVRGDHAVIKVINPTEQTKIAAIYAGDYWRETTMPVDIELDAPLVDKVIHTAGVNGQPLYGDVNVSLGVNNNATGFDRADQIGKLNVTIASDTMCSTLSLPTMDNLVLEKAARINIPKNSEFNVNNVTLKEGAVLDLRDVAVVPVVRGDFIGVSDSDPDSCGAIMIKNDSTLKVTGKVSGVTRLNTNGAEAVDRFVEGHSYVEASDASQGEFTIAGTQHVGFVLDKVSSNGKIQWVVNKQQASDDKSFGSFQWRGGQDTITSLEVGDEFYYPVAFYNKNGESYKPDSYDVLEEFELEVATEDGRDLSFYDIFFDWDDQVFGDNNDDLHQIVLAFYNVEKEYGNLILTVKHIASGASIQRTIQVGQSSEAPTPSVQPSVSPSVQPSVLPSMQPSVSPSVQPSVSPSVQPSMSPSAQPTVSPSVQPTVSPSAQPTVSPSVQPTVSPSVQPTVKPTTKPSMTPTVKPTVKPSVKPSIKLNKTSATLYTKGSSALQLTATVKGTSKKVTYTSSKKSVATVSSTGKVTALKAGTTTITAKANGVTATCKITVKKPVLTVNKTKVSVKKGKTVTITAKATPAKKITFTSSNKKIATVTSKGVIKGIKKGTAKIKVSCNGITKTVTVTVK